MLFSIVLLFALSLSVCVSAETRLYHLRVTLRNGERYETISTYDPVNYCHLNGGSVIVFRDYSLIFSREMKVKILRTWVDPSENLGERYADILQTNGMLAGGNRKVLPRVRRLTLRDMQRIEKRGSKNAGRLF
jgi:hypothetical protein